MWMDSEVKAHLLSKNQFSSLFYSVACSLLTSQDVLKLLTIGVALWLTRRGRPFEFTTHKERNKRRSYCVLRQTQTCTTGVTFNRVPLSLKNNKENPHQSYQAH